MPDLRRTRDRPWWLREPWIVLAPLVLAQWALVGGFALGVRRNGWLFYQGGDQTFLYTASWVLSGGHIPESEVGYAWPYLLAPVALVAGPSFISALPALVVLQTLVLLPVGLYCVYGIAARIAGRAAGYVVAAAWVAVPFAAIPLWDPRYHEKYVEQLLPQAFGMTGLADFPSMVCLLVAALLCTRALDSPQLGDGVLAGTAAGFAIGLKAANALFVPAALLAFLVARRFRAASGFGLALVAAALSLALWKYRGLGHLPIITPDPVAVAAGGPDDGAPAMSSLVTERYLDLDWPRLRDNYVQLRDVLGGFPALLALPLLGFVAAVVRSPPKALLLAAWVSAFALVKGTSGQASIEGGTLLRLLMPAFPPLLILATLVPLLVPIVDRRLRRWPLAAPKPIGRRAAVAAIIVFALTPALLFATLRPLRAPVAVKYFEQNVFVPVDRDFAVAVRRGDAGHVVSWRAPPTAGVRVFYRIFRSPPVAPAPDPALPPALDGIRCLDLADETRALDCRVQMSLVATTRSRAIVDAPPAGRWVYRVGVAANWRDDVRGGDVMLLSAPGEVGTRRRP